MPLKLNKYLFELRKNAIRFERIDINGKEEKRWRYKNSSRLICFAISLLFLFVMNTGFNEKFVSYISSVLSILIGLFISAIIFSFDKFYKKSSSKEEKHFFISITDLLKNSAEKEYSISVTNIQQATSKENLWETQAFNYAKQFAYLTGYSIVIAIFTIAFMALSTMFETKININIYDYFFDFEHIDTYSILTFLQVTFVIIQRLLVMYWIIKIMYNTLFIVSSMVNYMTNKLNREDDTN